MSLANSPIDADDAAHGAVLASDPLDWARRATILVYERHASSLASRARNSARRLEADGDRESADRTLRRAVDTLRHAHTNYDDLVSDVTAHFGRHQRNDAIAVLRHRVYRALAHRFPELADHCRALARERPAPAYRLVDDPHDSVGIAGSSPRTDV